MKPCLIALAVSLLVACGSTIQDPSAPRPTPTCPSACANMVDKGCKLGSKGQEYCEKVCMNSFENALDWNTACLTDAVDCEEAARCR